IATATATGTIVDDDAPPGLSVAASSAVEAGTMTFTVTLSASSGLDVTFNYQSTSGSAIAGADFTGVGPAPLTIAAGATSATFNVVTLGDALNETMETFSVSLASPVNATVITGSALGTIIDDDP